MRNRRAVSAVASIGRWLFVSCTVACRAPQDLGESREDPASLVVHESRDGSLRIEEAERHERTSVLRLTGDRTGWSSVPHALFIIRGAYEVAKARRAKYFINLEEWPAENDAYMYIIGFADSADVNIREEFGQEFTLENEWGQPRLLLSVSELEEFFLVTSGG